MMVTALSETYGWAELGKRVPIRCFTHDPSVSSSLKFLRRTPWARKKVEFLYLLFRKALERRKARASEGPRSAPAGAALADPSATDARMGPRRQDGAVLADPSDLDLPRRTSRPQRGGRPPKPAQPRRAGPAGPSRRHTP